MPPGSAAFVCAGCAKPVKSVRSDAAARLFGWGPQAEQGTLAIMVGGDRAAFDRVQPLLAQLGRPVTHVGGNGHGVLLETRPGVPVTRELEEHETMLSIEKARRVLGYQPKFTWRTAAAA